MNQGTQEWLDNRCGSVTASQFHKVLAKGKGLTRRSYLNQLVAERLTFKPKVTYKNAEMIRGHELEPVARMEYVIKTGCVVDQVGFIKHPTLMAGASPDGLINDDGGIEIKSVIPEVQIETIKRGGIPPEHIPQVQGNLWITGRKWWDFVSFSEDMPDKLRLYIFRVFRDDEYIHILETEVIKFLTDVDKEVTDILKLGA